MNNINNQTIKEIVDFINLTNCKTDMNLFERLNSDEILNIYIGCLIYLGEAKSIEEFDLNESEENIFASVVPENRGLKVIKVTALINHFFKKFGYPPDFSPVHIFAPTINVTQSTLIRFLEAKNKIEQFKKDYNLLSKDYEYTIDSCDKIIKMINENKEKKKLLIKTLEEGNKISNDININIEKHSRKIDEINSVVQNNIENITQLEREINNKTIRSEQYSKKIMENESILSELKERVAPDPENCNKNIENNKIKLKESETQKNRLQNELNLLYKSNEICMKIKEKLNKVKKNVEEYHDCDIKNKDLYLKKESNINNIQLLEKSIIEYKDKYYKNVEKLKNMDIMLKNQQMEYSNLINQIDSQTRDNEKIKSDLKEIMKHLNNEIIKNKTEINTIKSERNELQNIRNEYADVLGKRFQDLIKKQNLYYKLLDKSIELYEDYNIIENKEETKNNKI